MSSQRILYVEDNAHFRWMVTEILKFELYEVYSAADGVKGFDLALRINPHFILMDVHLPGMSGIEITARLRALPEFRAVPIIALTAGGEFEADCDKYLKAGFNGCLFKPFTAPQLVDTVRHYIGLAEKQVSAIVTPLSQGQPENNFL